MRSLSTDDGPASSVDSQAEIEELVVYPVADIWAKVAPGLAETYRQRRVQDLHRMQRAGVAWRP